MKYCSINYKIQPEDKATISINERGFLFGDGVFETCRIVNKKIYDYSPHLERLKCGLKAIKIDFATSKIQKNVRDLIKINNFKNGIVRIYISRGSGSFGYSPKKDIKPLIVIQLKDLAICSQEPVNLWLSDITKISNKSLPVNFKIAQGLNSTLAKIDAQENNCFDSLLLNNFGEICETSSANIFWVKGGVLYTPHEKCGILLGTTRKRIINSSPIETREVQANLNDIFDAEEIFLSNVSIGVLSIKKILPKGISFKSTYYQELFQNLLST
jgi:branched-subunit amino acid aminotransferase/4-amino-4-deoxychorismate lyase